MASCSAGHGLFTWGDDAKDCYENTLADHPDGAETGSTPTTRRAAFGGPRVEALPEAERAAVAARLMPRLRGRIAQDERKVGHSPTAPAVLEFVNSQRLERAGGARHLLPRPLPAHQDPPAGGFDRPSDSTTSPARPAGSSAYRADYAALLRALPAADSPAMRDPNAGHLSGPGRRHADLRRATRPPRASPASSTSTRSTSCAAPPASSHYVGLPEQEAFDIEYWLLEEAKLQRMPKPKALAGRVALVTGGAGGIGSAIGRAGCWREGACVVLTDIDAEALDEAGDELCQAASARTWCARRLVDVTDEAAVQAALRQQRSSGSAASTSWSPTPASPRPRRSRRPRSSSGTRTSRSWPPAISWSAREAFRLMKAQKLGGSHRLHRLARTRWRPRPAPRPIARPRRRRSIWPAAWRSRARRTASASTWSIRTRCCAARKIWERRVAQGSAPPPTSIDDGERWRSSTASARC